MCYKNWCCGCSYNEKLSDSFLFFINRSLLVPVVFWHTYRMRGNQCIHVLQQVPFLFAGKGHSLPFCVWITLTPGFSPPSAPSQALSLLLDSQLLWDLISVEWHPPASPPSGLSHGLSPWPTRISAETWVLPSLLGGLSSKASPHTELAWIPVQKTKQPQSLFFFVPLFFPSLISATVEHIMWALVYLSFSFSL